MLKFQEYEFHDFSLVPIRFEDRYDIMKWRNDQIDLLRQKEVLTIEEQDFYFKNVVAPLFENNQPSQLLFSLIQNNELIGYGGLVHIDWENKNAEISFLLDNKLNDESFYSICFNVFLVLIEKIAKEIKLHKIFTYGYDIAEYRFEPLIQQKYMLEAHMRNHVLVKDNLVDVKIYSKLV